MPLQSLTDIQTNAVGSKIPVDIAGLIGNMLPYIFGASSIALLIYLLMGGFGLMLSKGDPKAAQSAQAKITNAVVGFVIVVFAYLIVVLLGKVLRLEGSSFAIPFGFKSTSTSW